MSEKFGIHTSKSVKRLSISGVVVAVLALLVCELPILLSLFGVMGLRSAASNLELPRVIGLIGGVVGLILVISLIGFLTHRIARTFRS